MAQVIASLLIFAGFLSAHAKEYALTGLEVAEQLQIQPVYQSQDLGIALIELTDGRREKISHHMHAHGKCGGFELVDLADFSANSAPLRPSEQRQLEALFQYMPKGRFNVAQTPSWDLPEFSQGTADTLAQVSADRLREDVSWISAYPTRHHTSASKNAHVEEMQRRLQTLAQGKSYVKVELIQHSRTQQRSVRATLTGKERPSEIVALGAHFDSTNIWGLADAPGADDDASGSANLLEIFRLMMHEAQPERSIEFFWYAAEEVGLVGSAEIATSYRQANKDIVGVLQLDMTLYPGSGAFTVGLMTDFTDPWLRAYLTELNRLYTKAKFIEDKCGYGCSDHASWDRQGFPAAIPFESAMAKYNKDIHTVRDKISSDSDFEHSAVFTRLGLAYVLSLGNATHRGP